MTQLHPMHNKSFLLTLTIMAFACTTGPKSTSESDSLAIAGNSTAGNPVDSTRGVAAKPDPNLTNADTLFNILARQEVMQGEFVGVTVITDSFIDFNGSKEPRKLLAALIQTGEGTYSGFREGQTYETIHSMLGVFEWRNDGYSIVTFSDMGDSGGHHLLLFSTEGESLRLTKDGDAVMIHSKSSESGAGDYGFNKDVVSIYVLLNNTVINVIEATLEDYQWSSDEQTATSEQTITTKLSIGSEMTNGLYDISLQTTTIRSSTEEKTEEEEKKDDEEEKKQNENNPDDGGVVEAVYKWDGAKYVKQ